MKTFTRLSVLMLLLSFACSLFSGCGSSTVELAYRLTAGVVSVDADDEGYILSIACLDPRGTEEGKDAELQYLTAKAASIEEALKTIEESSPQRVFFGHATALIIGQEAREKRLEELLVYFTRDNRFRLNISVFTCKGSAAEFIRVKTLHKMSVVGTLQDLIENDSSHESVKEPFFRLCADVLGSGEAAIPLLTSRRMELSGSKEGDELFELVSKTEIEIERRGALGYN